MESDWITVLFFRIWVGWALAIFVPCNGRTKWSDSGAYEDWSPDKAFTHDVQLQFLRSTVPTFSLCCHRRNCYFLRICTGKSNEVNCDAYTYLHPIKMVVFYNVIMLVPNRGPTSQMQIRNAIKEKFRRFFCTYSLYCLAYGRRLLISI